jgi:large subunit ribosomal protein L29
VKPSELNPKSVDELAELEKSTSRELWQARFSNHSNQLDDTDKVRRLRRDIARVKTIITQKTREKK